jgi:hypothetical protein
LKRTEAKEANSESKGDDQLSPAGRFHFSRPAIIGVSLKLSLGTNRNDAVAKAKVIAIQIAQASRLSRARRAGLRDLGGGFGSSWRRGAVGDILANAR